MLPSVAASVSRRAYSVVSRRLRTQCNNSLFLQNVSNKNFLATMAENTKKPLLYTYCKSSCSWRVRIGLNYKEIDYDAVYIDIYAGDGDNHKPDYKAINPIGHVPALIIDDHLLLESMNILHYLEETRPQKPLMPKDPYTRAQVRVICEMVTTAIQPLQNKSVLEKVGDADKKMEWAAYFIARGFRALEKIISRSAGKYCVGNEITLADCSLVPQVYGALKRFNMDLSEFPTIVRIDNLLAEHPAFRRAHAEAQPDYQP